ncbi:ABC-type branched-subunit amino acid transport system ATPase component [Paraburkholderia unamae]|uniref:branched-chain amino acid ABC transporter ATP-binding protein/permease n=1 Tax=Paraburkholderia unamae TaxID=219649 RepID=UPI000DC57636|nr:ATP-binding cassette domain-containing protein [Paraburkholderia unamae]RAR53371.1 ABC-type branched-subunit amino acid transport system ATPase component [Paraburkholderia unamae]
MSNSRLSLAARAQALHPGTSASASAPRSRGPWPGVALAAVLLAAAFAACSVNGYFVVVLAGVALLAICGVGLNLLLGLTGQVSFGHAAFYAIGAYAVAILTTQSGWNFWAAWALGAGVSAAAGALLALPALRVRGPGLAMVTIAFGFVIEQSAVEGGDLTGGQNGIMNVFGPALGSFAEGERAIALVALATLAVALVLYSLVARGTWGAAMRAVRDSETASASIGVNALAVKTVAFAFSAALAGLAGGLFAPLQGMVTPGMFSFSQSILFVLVVMIGGAGSVAGPLVGAAVVGLLPELLAGLENLRLLCFGVLLLVVLWSAPDGVAGVAVALARRLFSRVAAKPGEAAAARDQDTVAAPSLEPLAVEARRALAAQGLSMTFDGVKAVSDLSFELPAARVTSLIGPNGAGKSTVLNMLSGFYRPQTGTRTLGGARLAAGGAFESARAGVARTYQTSQLFGSLSVLDNVALALTRGRLGALFGTTRMRGDAPRAEALALLRACGYHGDANAQAASLAHVDRRLVEIARALATRPAVLLLDEPAAGLSSEDKVRLGALLRAIADSGVAVGLVEHDMSLVMGVSDRIVVIDAGRFLAQGEPAAIRANNAVREAYLGTTNDDTLHALRPAHARTTNGAAAREVLGVGNVTTGYGAAPVLHDVSVQVREGELVALLGANGAGKSTLMRALAGLHRPVAGGVTFDGRDLTRLDAAHIAALGVVLVPEGRQVFPELSVLDNLKLGAFPSGRLPRGELEARIESMFARYPRLRERQHRRAGLLSGGEQQMLAIARALMSKPRVLLLDEPSLGLAPKVIAELFASLDDLRRESLSMLLVDQMAAMALAIADRGYVLEEGRVSASGTAAELAADPKLSAAYLGGHADAGVPA